MLRLPTYDDPLNFFWILGLNIAKNEHGIPHQKSEPRLHYYSVLRFV